MRVDATWNDVCILNISPRGMSLQTATPPPRGAYLDIRRGRHDITARVMWSRNHRFGVRTQDPLVVDDVINQPEQPAHSADPKGQVTIADRRESQRNPAVRHEASRMLSRAIEFAAIGGFALFAAAMTVDSVAEALEPLSKVSAALAPR